MSKNRNLTEVVENDGVLTIPSGTTAQRPASPLVGTLRYNTDNSALEQYTSTGWQSIEPPPAVSTVSPTSFSGEQGTSITVNGSNFQVGATVQFITSTGTTLNAATTTRNSSSQLVATTPRDITIAEEPISVRVTNPSGLAATLQDALDAGSTPSWSTSAGTLATVFDDVNGTLATIVASDPDSNSTVSYSVQSGALPGNVSLNSSSGVISGDPTNIPVQTTYSFTAAATDNAGNVNTRNFNIIVVPSLYGSASDGSLTVTSGNTFNLNSSASGSRSVADGVTYYITALSSGSASITCATTVTGIAQGDKVLIYTSTGNSSSYTAVGQYEVGVVSSVSGSNVTLYAPLANQYSSNYTKVFLQRIPQYDNVTIGGTLTAGPYDDLSNSSYGSGKYQSGIVAFYCLNTFTVSSGGIIDMNDKGYRGGAGWSGGTAFAGCGESRRGDNRGANAGDKRAQWEGGGGGGYHNSGVHSGAGGGGAYGGTGGNGYADGNGVDGRGVGGNAYGEQTLTSLINYGSGGGGGADGTGWSGGTAGGIIWINARTVNNSGTIRSNGGTGAGIGSSGDSGGGASGGAIYIKCNTISVGTMQVNGGAGGGGSTGSGPAAGGGGGGGRIAIHYDTSISGTATANGGLDGTGSSNRAGATGSVYTVQF